ncbi:glycoside hydrolase domain-containing protein [Bacteroidota bacterium]
MKYLWYFLIGVTFSCATRDSQIQYTTAQEPWPEGLGSQRAVLQIREPAEAVYLNLLWRRHDLNPQDRRFIIVNEASEDTVENVYRIHVDNEKCEIAFGPVKPGRFYFYYLPYKPDPDWGFFKYGYLTRENEPDEQWVNRNGLTDSATISRLSEARCSEIQSRTTFNSFYPMEVIPTATEKSDYIDQHPGDYLVFPEDRKYPIRMKDEIPVKWIIDPPGSMFDGEACRNEYYCFQLGLFAVGKGIKDVKIRFSDLKKGEQAIPASSFTCFNTEGIDPYGKPFTKRVDVERNSVQSFWIGVDIPENAEPGVYTGSVMIDPENSAEKSIDLRLKINKSILADRGDSEPWRHSRLRWLNSTLGIDDNPVAPYSPVTQTGDGIFEISGKNISLTEEGMPGSIQAWNAEILKRPVSFSISTSKENVTLPRSAYTIDKSTAGNIQWSWDSPVGDFKIHGRGSLEFDGTLNYVINLKAEKQIDVTDIMLELPFEPSIGQYMKGMDLRGSIVPDSHAAKWEGPHDSFWIGNTKGGLHCELRGSDYHGPLLNLFHPDYPDSWYNGDKGYFSIKKTVNEVLATVHSGSRSLDADEEINFEFSLLITPVKEMNSFNQFTNRYFHNAFDPRPTDDALDAGVKIINVHHGNKYNPYINYPFIATKEMRDFVDHWHEKGMKVKIYYTIREITNHVTEIWALRSLGNEILRGSKGSELPWLQGQGYPWLMEHFVDDYTKAWYHPFGDGFADAAILTAPGDSRWYNYYIEGLRWLVHNMDIDGLYLDDVTYDRRILKRMRKVMAMEKPGCIIDLHSNDAFAKGPANQYTEFFPYVDKLWFGEAFEYNEMSPENWLVEVSGIPFGHMGDMLQGGGNRWLGMLYGMTVRLPWTSENTTADPRPVWEVWDEFGISDSEMIGYWEDHCPVMTTHSEVLATVYQKNDEVLIALGNWAESDVEVRLNIDWQTLGLDINKSKLYAPGIKDFQHEHTFVIGESIPIKSKQGWLIFVEKEGI